MVRRGLLTRVGVCAVDNNFRIDPLQGLIPERLIPLLVLLLYQYQYRQLGVGMLSSPRATATPARDI